MPKKPGMTRTEALALLDAFRLDCEDPPAPDPGQVARRFIQIVCPDRLAYEKGPQRVERRR